jgi:hypothetical protein
MRIGEFVFIFGVFLLAFYASSSFLMSFKLENITQKEELNTITQAWEASREQLNKSSETVSSGIAKMQSGNFVEQLSGTLQAAFGTVFYVLLSLWNVFIEIPQAIFRAINYLLTVFGLDFVKDIVLAIVSVFVIIKMIEFTTGRSL